MPAVRSQVSDESDSQGSVPSRLLEILVCAACHGQLTQNGTGRLRCGACSTTYPITRGIPRILPDSIPRPLEDTAEAFGWQWHAFPEQHPAFRSQFLEWLHPVEPSELEGKRVLDAGCGAGRHLLLSCEFGPAHLIGLDISSAADVAKRLCADKPMIDVVQGNLLDPPFSRSSFDLIYSIGVIHHVPRPEEAIQALSTRLRPGGILHVWVYGHEGNAAVRWGMEPIRRLLATYAPRSAGRAITFPMAVAMAGIAKLAKKGIWPSRLPYEAYFRQISELPIRHIWTIVYDQLMTPTTHYIKRDELASWFRHAGLVDIVVRNSRGMSWTGTGRRP